MRKLALLAAQMALLGGCSGLRASEKSYSAHAENFKFLSFQIPGGDTQERALALVPEGGGIVTQSSSPIDLS